MPPNDVAVLRSFRKPVLWLWPYFTRPALLERWLGPTELEVEAGGAFRSKLWNGDDVRGEVLAVTPPNRLDLAWRADGPAVHREVRIRLEHEGPGSRVRVEHGDPGSEDERARARGWWREALNALHATVEQDRDAHEWGASLPVVLRAPTGRAATDLWPLLSTASGLEKWLAGAERFEAVEGGSFRFVSRFQGHEVIEEGRVAAIEPERLVALDWEWAGQGWESPTRVEMRLEPGEAGASLLLAHRGFDRLSPERRLNARRNYAAAWWDVLDDLRRLVAPGPGP